MKQAVRLSMVLLGIMLCSCGHLVKRIGPISDLKIEQHGSVGADIEATVTNQTTHNLRLMEATLHFYHAGEPIARAELVRPITLPRRTTLQIESRWRLRSEDPAATQLLLREIEHEHHNSIEVSIEASVRLGWIKKRFSIEKRPFSDFLRTFDAETYSE